jgi:O-antigen ligase
MFVWNEADSGSQSRWPTAFLVAALLLPPLPLPWGDSGVHPAILVAAVGLWLGVLRLRQWTLRLTLLSAALLLMLFSLLLSTPLALLYSGPSVAAGSLARVALFGLSVYLYFYLSAGPGRGVRAQNLIRLIYWLGLASAAYAILDFYFQLPAPSRFAPQFVWLDSGVYRRAQGLFYEASTLGVFCVFLLVLVVSIVLLRMGPHLRLSKPMLFLGASLFLSALIFSFSRTAIVNLVTSLLVLAWILRRRLRFGRKAVRVLGAGITVAAVGLVSSYRLFPDYFGAYFLRLQHSFEFFSTDPNLVLSHRLDSWGVLLEYLAGQPWRSFLGIGYKTLPYTTYLGRPVVADNMYLSLLIETGWLGLGSLLFLSAAILARCYRAASSPSSPIALLCGAWMLCVWFGLMLQMTSGDILTYWRILPALFAVLAILERDDDSLSRSVQ